MRARGGPTGGGAGAGPGGGSTLGGARCEDLRSASPGLTLGGGSLCLTHQCPLPSGGSSTRVGGMQKGQGPSKAAGSLQGAGSSHRLVCSGPPAWSWSPAPNPRLQGQNSREKQCPGRCCRLPCGTHPGPLWRKHGLPGRSWGSKGWSPLSCWRGGSGEAAACRAELDMLLSGCRVFPSRPAESKEPAAYPQCPWGGPCPLIWGTLPLIQEPCH